MSTSTIDPRIRARRIAVQRDEGRKRLRRVGTLATVAAAAAGLWGITLTPLLDVDHVRVTGAAHTGAAAVAGATGVSRGDALLTAQLGRAASRVAALPWVQTVEVRRQWPGTVRVEVVERKVTAAVPSARGGWVVIDAEGRQLETRADPGPGVLRVEIPAVTPAPGAVLAGASRPALQLAATVPAPLRDRLVALRPAGGGGVEGTVELADGGHAVVQFGRPDQLSAKWLALASVLADADPAGVTDIDVRVPSAPALTRR